MRDEVRDVQVRPLPSADEELSTRQRECPVPKPSGVIGSWLGITPTQRQRPVEVVVLPVQDNLRPRKHNEEVSAKGVP